MVVAIGLLLPLPCIADGIVFTQGPWAEILRNAKQQDRLIFIDVYTSWCGPCKKMAKEAFPDQKVGDFFNFHFINYSIDAEKGEGIDIAKRYGVDSYPTCLFINGDGDLIYKFTGYKNAQLLLEEGKSAIKYKEVLPQLHALKRAYEGGRRDKSLLKDYSLMMIELGKDPGEVFTEYLSSLTDTELFSEETVKYWEKMSIPDTTVFNKMLSFYNASPDSITRVSREKILMTALGSCMKTIISKGDIHDERIMKKMIAIKEQMGIKGNTVGKYMFSGSYAYLKSDHIMLYYYEKADIQTYLTYAKAYMDKEMSLLDGEKLYSSFYEGNLEKKLLADSLRQANNEEELKKKSLSWGVFGLAMTLTTAMEADMGISIANIFWRNSPQADRDRELCIKWAKWAINIFPRSGKCALEAARLFEEMGNKKEAKAVIDEAINYVINDPTDKEAKDALEKLRQLQESLTIN